MQSAYFHLLWTHPRKLDIDDYIPMAVALIERQFNFKIKQVMSDKEQSVRTATEDVLREEGFVIDSSVIDNYSQNGAAEALGAAIISMARSLIGANLPRDLWPEAVKAAVWLFNRIRCEKLNRRAVSRRCLGA